MTRTQRQQAVDRLEAAGEVLQEAERHLSVAARRVEDSEWFDLASAVVMQVHTLRRMAGALEGRLMCYEGRRESHPLAEAAA